MFGQLCGQFLIKGQSKIIRFNNGAIRNGDRFNGIRYAAARRAANCIFRIGPVKRIFSIRFNNSGIADNRENTAFGNIGA